MERAQEIRNKMLAKKNEEIVCEAKRIFYWILDIFNDRIERGHYGELKVYVYEDSFFILSDDSKYDEKYELDNILLIKFDRLMLFSKLKEIIEQEEGFFVKLYPNDNVWDGKAISLIIKIE